jgi:lia operon protein LiaF
MENRNRNTALVLIAAGVFLLLEHQLGFVSMVALLLIALGFYKSRAEEGKSGYIMMVIGVVMLVGGHLAILLPLLLISLGIFLIRSKQLQRDGRFIQKHKIIESYKQGQESWVLKSLSLWHIVGEIQMDLTQAIPEQEVTTIVLQGVIGDIDIVTPDYIGLSVNATALFGQMHIGHEKEAGFTNRLIWQSPDYEQCTQKVHIEVSYLIADIDIKVL